MRRLGTAASVAVFFSAIRSAQAKELEVTRKSTDIAAAEQRDGTIYTMQQYIELQEKEEQAANTLQGRIASATDNPRWVLYALAFVATAVAYFIISMRLREEQRRFNPKFREVRVLDAPEGPSIGGPFELIDVNGRVVRDTDFAGKWIFVYFGFSHCPDVCPQEMAKLTRLTTKLDQKVGADYWQPLFITIDANRDTPTVLREYLSDFHHRIRGLTGTAEQVEHAARQYRVYYSVPEGPSAGFDGGDYLIDHSIVMYLINPEGKFSDYTTKEFSWMDCYGKLLRRMTDYEKERQRNGQPCNARVLSVDSFHSEARDAQEKREGGQG